MCSRSRTAAFTRLIVLSLAMLLAPLVQAQQPVTYQFRTSAGPAALTNVVRKQIHWLVKDIDPDGRVGFHDDLVKLKLAGTDVASLMILLGQLGAGAFVLEGSEKDPRPYLPGPGSTVR